GKTLVTAEDESILTVWDTSTGKQRCQMKAKDEKDAGMRIDSLVISADGRRLAVAIGDHRIAHVRLWDLATRRGRLLRQQPHVLRSPLFSADGKVLVVRQDPDVKDDPPPFVRLWEVESGLPRRLELKGSGAVNVFALSADGEILATGEGRRIRLWDLLTEKEIGHFDGHRGAIKMLAFSADCRALLSGSADTTALIWDIKDLISKTKRLLTDLKRQQFDALWSNLAGGDALCAGDSLRHLILGRQTVALLKERLHPVAVPEKQRISRLLIELDSDEFTVRERATHELQKFGESAVPSLRKSLADHPSLEARRRIEDILARQPGVDLRKLRAIEVLEHIGSDEARQLLRTLAKGVPEARLTQEAKAALKRSAVR
ncbi:MAG: WD40 repeat domain-containing protein, partial [Gemmataceae bacterium]